MSRTVKDALILVGLLAVTNTFDVGPRRILASGTSPNATPAGRYRWESIDKVSSIDFD